MVLQINYIKKPIVLSIGGSDPSGGAGIQADIRAFEAIGVHGCTTITALTVQTFEEVISWEAVKPELVKAQLHALLKNYSIKYVKCGMVPTKEIVKIIADAKKQYNFTLIYDPIINSGSGKSLVKEEVNKAIIEILFPCFGEYDVITPNAEEAKAFTDIEISTVQDIHEIGSKFEDMGVKRVIIKGGHIFEEDSQIMDYLCMEGGVEMFSHKRIEDATKTHGTGCIFSSILTSYLALTDDILHSMELTEEALEKYFKKLYYAPQTASSSKGIPILNVGLSEDKIIILEEVYEIYSFLRTKPLFSKMIPEVKTNISVSMKNATSKEDVAAIEGRITVINGLPFAVGPIKFGVSNHTARLVMTAQKKDPEIRVVVNLKYQPEFIAALADEGFYLFEIDRENQQDKTEDNTMQWVIDQSYKAINRIPDIIWDDGEKGKEPMLRIFAKDAKDMVDKLIGIHRAIKKIQ